MLCCFSPCGDINTERKTVCCQWKLTVLNGQVLKRFFLTGARVKNLHCGHLPLCLMCLSVCTWSQQLGNGDAPGTPWTTTSEVQVQKGTSVASLSLTFSHSSTICNKGTKMSKQIQTKFESSLTKDYYISEQLVSQILSVPGTGPYVLCQESLSVNDCKRN